MTYEQFCVLMANTAAATVFLQQSAAEVGSAEVAVFYGLLEAQLVEEEYVERYMRERAAALASGLRARDRIDAALEKVFVEEPDTLPGLVAKLAKLLKGADEVLQ